ncbi:MAG: 3-deoxy-manno-octulosonate cytidylyltransferase [Candidatus Omnitrophica bacterium]|nr:3-deoxy-manno-octulosonate cytidylyltransferase [Candidatus Omnitrophota bacterium]MBU1997536.1 3-deoxy-manno-octulosonate cytidylyltransferase [Candidatus Omnitrophota bacterium]MBU4334746.1 3-deoxy-manno-octulosonate cytidylyltransferase [Candidatus Omnitrophota bacterium]
MNIIGIIPARMASTRFPGKPLAKIKDIPMIGHCYFRSKMCSLLSEVYVATCDEEVKDYIESVGGKAVMTKDTHERASERASEAMEIIEKETGSKVDIVVMIQGDEPMLYPEMIDEAVKPLIEDESILVSNLMAPLKTREEHDDPNEVKVVVDKQNFALYFSREPIPSWKKGAKEVRMLKQVCIIPFRRDFLVQFNEMGTTELEIVESVDMLRVLEYGHKVKMIFTEHDTYSVDTQEDLNKVEKLMDNDVLVEKYKI